MAELVHNQHMDYLDGWRGLAIVFLLIGHFYPIPGINFGSLGVNLFFVLSGLLMSRLLFVKSVPIPLFYRRRISRIFPAFFVLLVAIVVIFLILKKEINWSEVAMAALFVNNYFPGEIGNAVMPLGHIWSLSVEEHAYILLSLIAIASRQRWANPVHAVAFFTCVFAFAGTGYWLAFSGPELEFGMWLHSEVSAYGIFVSALFLLILNNRKIPRLPLPAYPALILLGIALHWWSVPSPVRTIFGVGVLALTINLLAEAPQSMKAALSIPPLRHVGIRSFSLYLWQQPFYLLHYRDGMPSWMALGFAIAAGVASFHLIENPVRLYLNSRWAREEEQAGAPVAHPIHKLAKPD